MKASVEVEARLRELLVSELQRRLTREVLPELCSHNHRQPLDNRKMVYGDPNASYNRIGETVDDGEGHRVALPVLQTMGLCMLGAESIEEWPGNICEEPIDAQRCPYFEYKVTRVKVYDTFVAEVSDPAWVEASLPAVHALLWVLGSALHVKRASGFERLRRWVLNLFGLTRKNSADVLVYLPTLDACGDEARTTPAH